MSIVLNDNLKIEAPKLIDERFGPHANLSAALAFITPALREMGLIFFVKDGSNLLEYWWPTTDLSNSGVALRSYQPLDADLTAIANIVDGATGFLKKTAPNTWSLDTTVVTASTAAGGELEGFYPNPTLKNISVINKVLSGFNTVGGGTIVDGDSILVAFGKVQNQLNALYGGMQFIDFWNATTNSPSIPAASLSNKGNYYIVQVAGSTNIGGITDWRVGDWLVSNGSVWSKIDNTDAVVSVNGYTGAVTLTTSDIAEGTNLYYTDLRVKTYADTLYSALGHTHTFDSLTSKPTTIAGYGITDAYTTTQINSFFLGSTPITGYNKTNWDLAYGWGNHALAGYVKGTGVDQRIPYFNAVDTVTTSSRFIWNTSLNALIVNQGIAGTIGSTLSGAFDGGSLQVWNGHELAVMGSTVGNSGDVATMIMRSNRGISTANGYVEIQAYYAGGTTNAPIIMQRLGGVIIIGNIAAGTDATSLLQVNGPIRQTSVTSALLKASATGVLQAAVAGTDYLVSADLNNYYTQTQIQNFFSGASVITGYNKSNWDTAFGWGNHASAGYITAAHQYYIGTTLNALNRASAAQTLTGVSIDGQALLLGASGSSLTAQRGSGTVSYDYAVTNPQTGLFPASDNSNSILTLNRHPGDYYSQLGFSSNGNLYYRSFSGVPIDTTQGWQTILSSVNFNQFALPLSGGTISGPLTVTGAVTFNNSLNIQGANMALRVNGGSFGNSGGEYFSLGYNVGFTATSGVYNYIYSEYASMIRFQTGGLELFSSTNSGISGNSISFTRRFRIMPYGDVYNTGGIFPGYDNALGYNEQGSYYLYGNSSNSGIRTNGNFLIEGDIYFGNRTVWLSSWLNQAVRTDASPTFVDLYVNSWFRNNISNTGLYNQANNTHFYSSANYQWDFASAATSYLQIGLRPSGHGTLPMGYIYVDTGANVGFLNSGASWALRMDNAKHLHGYGGGNFVNDITNSAGQGRFGGWYTGTGYTGPAAEIGFSGGVAVLIGYNRNTGAYTPLSMQGGGTSITLDSRAIVNTNIQVTGGYIYGQSDSSYIRIDNTIGSKIAYGDFGASVYDSGGVYLKTNDAVRLSVAYNTGLVTTHYGLQANGSGSGTTAFSWTGGGTTGYTYSDGGGAGITNAASFTSGSLVYLAGTTIQMYSGSSQTAQINSNSLWMQSNRGIIDGSFHRVTNPGGGTYVTGSSSVTGAIKIRMPNPGSAPMMSATVKIYEYITGRAFTLTFAGHTSGGSWYNTTAYIVGDQPNDDRAINVRFGSEGGYYCVWIGETSTSWTYPQVWVTDVQIGFASYSNSWASDWAVSFETVLGSISQTRTVATPSSSAGAYSMVRRDSNGYVVNSYFYTSVGGAERNGSGLGYFAGFNSSDYYIRSYTPTAARIAMGLATTDSPTFTGITLTNISGSSQTINNTYGAYLHLGAWGVARTASNAILVNTAYRADYADALFNMNISQFTNNSGYITSAANWFGAVDTGGTLDWNHVTNTRPGTGHTLLLGNASNGPGPGNYYHSLNFEYSSKDGTGQITQFAIAYGTPGDDLKMRGRYTGVWSSWVTFLNTSNALYAANMNQYVRTTDNVTFNTGYFTNGGSESDVNLKNIVSYGSGLNIADQIRLIQYYWKDAAKGTALKVGYEAQWIQQLMPNAVMKNTVGNLAVDYQQVHTVLIDENTRRIQALERDNVALKTEVAILKQQLNSRA